MQFSFDKDGNNAISAYDKNSLVIKGNNYTGNLLVSKNLVQNFDIFPEVLDKDLEIVLIGVDNPEHDLIEVITQDIVSLQIGLEIMSLSAAYRTFNVLLNEQRNVLGVFLRD